MSRSLVLALLLPVVACSGDDAAESEATGAIVTATSGSGTSVGTTASTTASTSSDATTTTATTTASGETESTGVSATDPATSEPTTDPTMTTGPTTTDPTTTTDATSTSDGTTTDTTTTGTTGEVCPDGTIVCEGNTAHTCDGMGGYSNSEDCGEDVCVDGLGCLLCEPFTGTCDGDKATYCNEQGDGYIDDFCDPVQGQVCDPNAGQCTGACSSLNLGLSYIGCDYYPTVLPQNDGYNTAPTYIYAVTVSNTTNQVAKITVTRGANTVATDMVPANSVKVINLPWINETVKGIGTKMVADGTYRLRSDQPVTVYQYNPIGATVTNDASLLLPVNAWTPNSMVSAWKGGYYAVVAAEDGTIVDLHPSTTGSSVQAGVGVNANGTGQVNLGAGDILIVYSTNDVTGTIVTANKPIEAFGGHKCTNIPPGACDHLEEAALPLEALAKEYVVAPTAQYPNSQLDKPQYVRIIASEDSTTLSFDPDQPAAKFLAKAGDFVEIASSTAHFKVSADKKVLVTQYMVGQSAQTGDSDPAFVTAIPTEQYRTNYLIYAAPSWKANFVDVIAPTGAKAEVDGVNVVGFKPIGGSGYSVAHVQLSNAGNGNHTVTADEKVGISVYGVQNYGSYWYPGGTDLSIIPQ